MLTDRARRYRLEVLSKVRAVERVRFEAHERLKIFLIAYPPDKRKRDIDNLLKAVIDALQHASVFPDDSQIDDLHIIRGQQVKDGRVLARVELFDYNESVLGEI